MLCAIALAVAPAATASPTLGIFGSGSATRLVQLDPRTMRPLDQGVRIGVDVIDTARSPDGLQVAVATVDGPLIVDPRRHRVQTPGGADSSQGIVWPGMTAGREPLLVAVGSSGYGTNTRSSAQFPVHGNGHHCAAGCASSRWTRDQRV